MKVWEATARLSLLELLKADADVTARLSAEQLDRAVRPRPSASSSTWTRSSTGCSARPGICALHRLYSAQAEPFLNRSEPLQIGSSASQAMPGWPFVL
ncbi:hypothetical protein [Hyphomicrobium sp. D-2]|uniref:hypothetical protein n=1 Tax=Hyphomicrobium sp. D-2 TaxID=3041621 RepID=UPI002456EFA2|nr:hypothetical protein [Hyphomicrobium sp. D-2]MDH4981796.1 hypothetical protein [Hyphomicrobium sp. D-2]